MPRTISDQQYRDFSGGLRLDISPIALPDNAVQKAINVNFETGRISKREGYKCFGSTVSYTPSKVDYFYKSTGGTTSNILAEQDSSSDGNVYELKRNPLNGAITTASTSVIVNDGAQFASSGTAEVNGDVFTYTGKSSNTLTGVTGLSTSHADDSPVRQWNSEGTFSMRVPPSTSKLNEYIFVSGFNKIYNYNNVTLSNNSTDYSYTTNYHRKIFGVDLSSTAPNKIAWSNADDGTTWTATDYFYAVKGDGKFVTALSRVGDLLGIWKEDEFWTWDEYTLKQRSRELGTYNIKLPVEIDGKVYFFGPKGVFITNGIDFSPDISNPVRKYLDDFSPTYYSDTVCLNTAAGRYKNKYILHIGNTSTQDTITDANLVYDTINKNWTVWAGLDADGMCFNEISKEITCVDGSNDVLNETLYLFGGSTNKQVYQYGGVYHDNWTDISSEVVFKPFDLGAPHRKKKFVHLKVLSENPGFELYYKIDDQQNWEPAGQITKQTQKIKINKKGYRITFKITETSQNKPWIFNGFVFEDCLLLED